MYFGISASYSSFSSICRSSTLPLLHLRIHNAQLWVVDRSPSFLFLDRVFSFLPYFPQLHSCLGEHIHFSPSYYLPGTRFCSSHNALVLLSVDIFVFFVDIPQSCDKSPAKSIFFHIARFPNSQRRKKLKSPVCVASSYPIRVCLVMNGLSKFQNSTRNSLTANIFHDLDIRSPTLSQSREE